jgi:hypothetical protein
MRSVRDTIIIILRASYNNDKVLQARYKTCDDFIKAVQNTKTPQEYMQIFKGTESKARAKNFKFDI